jgi:hypothetical protein
MVTLPSRVSCHQKAIARGARVVGSGKSKSGVVALDQAFPDVVGGFTAEEEAVAANDKVRGEGGPLEGVDVASDVEAGLLVVGTDDGCADGRSKTFARTQQSSLPVFALVSGSRTASISNLRPGPAA